MNITPLTPNITDSETTTLRKILLVLIATYQATGGQIVSFVADPTAEGVVPLNQNAPAIAVSNNAALSWHNWDTVNHVWL